MSQPEESLPPSLDATQPFDEPDSDATTTASLLSDAPDSVSGINAALSGGATQPPIDTPPTLPMDDTAPAGDTQSTEIIVDDETAADEHAEEGATLPVADTPATQPLPSPRSSS